MNDLSRLPVANGSTEDHSSHDKATNSSKTRATASMTTLPSSHRPDSIIAVNLFLDRNDRQEYGSCNENHHDHISNDDLVTPQTSDMELREEWKLGDSKDLDEIDQEEAIDTTADHDGITTSHIVEAIDEDEPRTVPTHPGKNIISDDCVRADDVLLGRGRPLQKHPGNVILRELIAVNFDRYEASRKKKQTEMSRNIVRAIVLDGGRFLKMKPSDESGLLTKETSWIELDDDEARLKVAYTFRAARKLRKKICHPQAEKEHVSSGICSTAV